jgi:hypothetical protein
MPVARAQGASHFVLIPYEDPTGTDPHAKQITETLAASLNAAGINVTVGEQMNPLDAIASAAQMCAHSSASGIFVVAGRYEQTRHVTPAGLFLTVTHYSTHVDLRLDQIACDGTVGWSDIQKADIGRSGVDYGPGNVGADVDSAFRKAIDGLVLSRSSSAVSSAPARTPAASTAPAASATAAPISTLVLAPIEEPGIGDPHGADMTNSLLLQLQKRNFTVSLIKPVDHDTIPATAATLCQQHAAQGILVPHIRIEQSGFTMRSHATFSATLLSCSGVPIAHASNDADMGTLFSHNFTAQATGVFERATGPALDGVFPQTKSAPSPAPTPTS